MTDSADAHNLINTIAPALRMLLPREGVPCKVSVAPESSSGLQIELKADHSDQKAVVAEIAEAIAKEDDFSAVTVEGIATFEISTGIASDGRARGKVAIVTGAAQGFGLEIAQDLASQGATVALADINIKGAESAAVAICDKYGDRRAIAVEMNVTSADSVKAMVDEVVKDLGGLDILIANAGVVKAESVKTQPEKDFDFVSDVNYKGYFLCTQAVAPVLAAQHLADPDYMSDIIQINSKSGLAGSNRNAAYAGSKFGGLGLTQSFAMELIEDGIKVNSICPGNFFDGPLWSDPDRGLFVQYLQSDKVPGAKSIEDVKKFYEAKVPMGRGCTTPDVMTAVYYLLEQRYETGQAVPVTGGQVMLK